MRNYQIQFVLLGPKGSKIAESALDTLQTSQWLPGETCPTCQKVEFEGVPAGEYQIAFALSDPATQRAITLPIAGIGVEQRCSIGQVVVSPVSARRKE